MIRKFEPDKIIITEFFRLFLIKESAELIKKMSYVEFANYIIKPVLAYKEIDEESNIVSYTPLLGTEPFNSYAEAEAARLQFIHDHCELPKDDFEL